MAKKNGHAKGHSRSPGFYRSYSFRTKDPAIDELRTEFETYFGHRVKNKDFTMVEEDGGPSASTMRNWFFGKTRRPTNAALEASGRAIGRRRIWVKL